MHGHADWAWGRGPDDDEHKGEDEHNDKDEDEHEHAYIKVLGWEGSWGTPGIKIIFISATEFKAQAHTV